jgi:hypothetical protein
MLRVYVEDDTVHKPLQHVAYCSNCHTSFVLTQEALDLLHTWPNHSNALLLLDEIHCCCSKPDHRWIICPVDISKVVLDAERIRAGGKKCSSVVTKKRASKSTSASHKT